MNLFNRSLLSTESAFKYGHTSSFSQSLLTHLSQNQQKIVVIAAVACVALAILSALFIAYNCCFTSDVVFDEPFSHVPYSPMDPLKKDPLKMDDVDQKNDVPLSHQFKPKISDPYLSPVFGKKQAQSTFDPADYIFDDEDPVLKVAGAQTPQSYSPYVPPKQPHAYPHKTAAIDPYGHQHAFQQQPTIYHPYGYPQRPAVVDPYVYQPKPAVSDPYAGIDPTHALGQQKSQPPSDPVLTPLYTMEKQIEKLAADLKSEEDMLAVLQQSLGTAEDDAFLEQEQNIENIKGEIEQTLKGYPKVFGDYLSARFSSYYGKKYMHEVHEHVVNMAGYMKRYSAHESFVRESLQQIDAFLYKTFFNSPGVSSLQEEKKADVAVFHEFFAIVDEHYPLIERHDSTLAHRLKIKLANLPLAEGPEYMPREHFENIYLNESDQRQILIDHFTADEDRAVDNLIRELQSNPDMLTAEEIKRLEKLIDPSKQRLLPDNIDKLAPVFEAIGPNISKQGFSSDGSLADLYRASKARRFFERQQSIPRWYHSTQLAYLEQIVKAGEIQVQHRQMYNGAWVSTEREPDFSTDLSGAVLIFSHDIAAIDPDVFIGYEKGIEKKRWRGLQKPIQLRHPTKQDKPYLALISLGTKAKKADKDRIVALMKSKGVQQPFILSLDIIDYIQKSVTQRLGNPNLTEKWWGKGDIKEMDKPLVG